MYVHVYIYMYMACMCWCLWRQEKGIRSLGAGVRELWAASHRFWDLSLGPLQEPWGLLPRLAVDDAINGKPDPIWKVAIKTQAHKKKLYKVIFNLGTPVSPALRR